MKNPCVCGLFLNEPVSRIAEAPGLVSSRSPCFSDELFARVRGKGLTESVNER